MYLVLPPLTPSLRAELGGGQQSREVDALKPIVNRIEFTVHLLEHLLLVMALLVVYISSYFIYQRVADSGCIIFIGPFKMGRRKFLFVYPIG